MLDFHKDFSQGWVLTFLSSALCVLGCFIIYMDDIYYLLFPKWLTSRYPFNLKENYSFMNGSLSFSSGCLLLTALYRLLPEALKYLQSSHKSSNENRVLILSFATGILTCVIFNEALHYFTSESVVHCSHDGEHKMSLYSDLEEDGHSHHHGHGRTSSNSDGHHDHSGHSHSHDHIGSAGFSHQVQRPSIATVATPTSELAPLLGRKKSSRLLHYFTHPEQDDEFLGECKGYSSAELCLHRDNELHFCEIPQLDQPDDVKPIDESDESSNTVHEEAGMDDQRSHSQHNSHQHSRVSNEDHLYHASNEHHHHHHVNLPLSRLLLIGIQTILALTLHKLPEGFITYITSETNPQLGVLIFLSLLIHNYTEGFSMCLPLYYSFPVLSKWRKLKAVSASALLGGLSQPFGAFGGFLFMRYYTGEGFDLAKLDQVFGISMAVTSGFLVVIALSMYGSAVSFSGLPNFVMLWCLLGMGVIGLLTVFVGSK